MLTRALLDTGARVVAVERDAELADGLRKRFRGGISVVEADALDWTVPTEPFAVVANLPFAGSGAILSRLLRGPVTRAVVIVDWAFAQKQVAVWPTTLKSTYWRAFYELELARRLDRTAFAPPPSVDAAVMRFTRRTDPLVPTGDAQRYWQFLSRTPSTQARKSGGACSRRFRRNGWRRPSAFDRPRGHETSTRASGPASTPRPGARRPGYDGE